MRCGSPECKRCRVAVENSDPRYLRSRWKLRTALLEIAHDDPDALSVSAISERTGVDRATFYRHFESLDELVADALGDHAARATEEWEAKSNGSGTQYEESSRIIAGYLAHIEDNWRLYQWALGGSIRTVQELLGRLTRSIASELQKVDSTLTEAEIEFRSSFSAGGILGVCMNWLSHEAPQISSSDLTVLITRIAAQPRQHLFGPPGQPAAE